MFSARAAEQFHAFTSARLHFCRYPQQLIEIENYLLCLIADNIERDKESVSRDFNEASYLFPFWKNYPPEERGRKPKGDQFPWIEVGEHAIGGKISRYLSPFNVINTGLPTGADQRLIVRSPTISEITGGFTDAAWLHLDIKSVGPRDDGEHAVMSPNQISGNGIWKKLSSGVRNMPVNIRTNKSKYSFFSTLSPIYVLSDLTVAPTVVIVVKPVYAMLGRASRDDRNAPQKTCIGQPLKRITVAGIPNGLLLWDTGYLKSHRGLFYPGKDGKDAGRKRRARVDFEILAKIDNRRIKKIDFRLPEEAPGVRATSSL